MRKTGFFSVSMALLVINTSAPAAAQQQPAITLPPVEVIGISPLLGTGIEKEKFPANVQTIDRKQFEESQPLTLGDMLNTGVGSVTINEVQNNPFQPDVQFRGFTAGPLLGTPQGISVYQNGTRINEPFGDVVQWDVIPEFAINSVQIIPGANPVFGLNTLGGALAIEMKNGFTFREGMVEAYGGSFGRYQVTGEYGGVIDNFGYYIGVTGFDEKGWRDESPSNVQQVYSDARWRTEKVEVALNFTYANTDLTGNGPAPVELLSIDREAVFTFPDNTQNELFFVGAQGNYAHSDTVSFQSNLYYRKLDRDTLNGDEQDFEDCTGIGGPAGTLCENAGTPDEEQILDLSGNPIPTNAGGNGAFNSSVTKSDAVGGSLQTTLTEAVFGMRNHFVFGIAVDAAWVEFRNRSEVGTLTPNRTVIGSGFFVAGDEFNADVDVENFFLGVYFSNTLSITDDFSLTLAGRFNHANIDIQDNLGTDLTSDNTFNRFNPAVGVAYQLTQNATAYANYSESNRAPSAAELGCSDPAEPCRFPNAFVADPPLEDVVTRSVEAGLRGRFTPEGDDLQINWSVAGFASRNFDDIIFVGTGTPIGAGFFQNIGRTQRVGMEAGVHGRYGALSWYANYSFVDATFQSNFPVFSPGNPFADPDGLIQVQKGDRIPGIPQHSAKVGVGIKITDAWFLGVETIIAGSQFLRGDESNQLGTVDGYAIVNLQSSYRIAQFGNPSRLEAFVRVNNLFNADYETFGIVAGSPEDVLGPGFTNPIFLSPGAPLGVWAGLRLTF